MKQQTLIALSALMFSSSVLANGGFEPNKKACVNVGKEITHARQRVGILLPHGSDDARLVAMATSPG